MPAIGKGGIVVLQVSPASYCYFLKLLVCLFII